MSNEDTRDEKRDEMADRLSSRFETPENEDTPAHSDTPDQPDTSGNPDKPDNPENPENPEQTDKPDNSDAQTSLNPKEAWTGRNIYVPDGERGPDMLAAFDGEYRRFQYECDWEIRKQQHYYPVLIQVGIDHLEEMDGEDFTAIVEDLGLR